MEKNFQKLTAIEIAKEGYKDLPYVELETKIKEIKKMRASKEREIVGIQKDIAAGFSRDIELAAAKEYLEMLDLDEEAIERTKRDIH